MKKSIIILSFSLLLLACGQEKREINAVNQTPTNLKELQNQKVNYTNQINTLNKELISPSFELRIDANSSF